VSGFGIQVTRLHTFRAAAHPGSTSEGRQVLTPDLALPRQPQSASRIG